MSDPMRDTLFWISCGVPMNTEGEKCHCLITVIDKQHLGTDFTKLNSCSQQLTCTKVQAGKVYVQTSQQHCLKIISK